MNFFNELYKKYREKAIKPYQKRKKVVDLDYLEKHKINKKYLALLLFGIIIFLLNKKYFIFLLLTIFSGFFSYYHSRINQSPLDLKLALFLGLFITKYYGLHMTAIFFFISDLLPSLLGGESIDAATFAFVSWYFIVNAIVLLFPAVSLIFLGPILVVIEAIGSIFINKAFGIPAFMSFFLSIMTIVVRIIYFLTLGRLLEALFLTF
ncbi:MAG: hypothetical protein QXR96_02175 [Candidatus Woesearchaeota archaeon]